MCRKLSVFVLVLGLAGNASAVLVGYWALDGDATDSSDYGNHGTINGNVEPAMDRFGNPSGAMSFAGGGGDNINIGDAPEFNMTGAMSILGWAYLDTSSSVYDRRNCRILGKMGGGGRRAWSAGIEHRNNTAVHNRANFQISSNGSDVISCEDDATIPLDEWFHYAGVYKPGEYMQVYINGDLAMSVTTGIPATQYSTNGQSVLIGNRPEATDCGWYGSLDEVRIYNEALTEAHIKAVMAIKSGAAQKEAHDPQPENGATDIPVDATLSWTTGVDLTDPNIPNPAITGHNLWLSAAYDPMNPPAAPDWLDPAVTVFQIGADTNPADGSVDLTASYNPPLQMDALYYWIVDESVGAASPTDWENILQGAQWSFETVTSGPVADAGSSIVTWLEAGTTTVDLNAMVTDATGDVTAVLWSVVDSPPDSTVDIADTSVVVTTATLTATGQYVLELYAVDAVQHEDSDTMEIDVYADACEAAKNNPNGYTAPLYDFNDDCQVDFMDFVMFAAGWLQDESLIEDAIYDPDATP